MHGSGEDEGLFSRFEVVAMADISFLALEDLSALVVHDPSQDISSPMSDFEGDVVTLTHLPRSRWQTLLNLDVIQVGFYTFPFYLFHSYWTNSKEISQKSLRRPQKRRPFSCLHLQGSNHGWWFQKKKRRRHPQRNPKKLSQARRACSFKN